MDKHTCRGGIVFKGECSIAVQKDGNARKIWLHGYFIIRKCEECGGYYGVSLSSEEGL